MMKKFLLLLVCLSCCFFPLAGQDTLYVNSDVHVWEGQTAYNDLQDAVDAAIAGDQIWVAAGTYYPTASINNNGGRYRSFILKRGITILGGFIGTETAVEQREIGTESFDFANQTILSGDVNHTPNTLTDDAYHVLWLDNNATNVTINGVVIENGYANGTSDADQKGGATVLQDSCTLIHCILRNNCAGVQGGAVYMMAGSHIFDCYFIENQVLYAASKGGAIYAATNSFSEEIIAQCLFERNSITTTNSEGGAIYSGNNNRFADNIFRYNRSVKNGGAVCSATGCRFDNCIFEQNQSTNGGAVYSTSTNLVISNCLFTNNVAQSKGGALYATGSGNKVVNTTLVGNYAAEGGAVYGTANVMLYNAIVWHNNATTDAQLSSAVACRYSAIQDVTMQGNGNINLPADNAEGVKFLSPADVIGLPVTAEDSLAVANSNYALFGYSVCKDAGSNLNIELSGYTFPNTDLVQNPRFNGEAIDLGAYEIQCEVEAPVCQYNIVSIVDSVTALVDVAVVNYDENLLYTINYNGQVYTFNDGHCELQVAAPTATFEVTAEDDVLGCMATAFDTIDVDSMMHISVNEYLVNNFAVYPNPVTDCITIESAAGQNELFEITIFGLRGEVLRTMQVYGTSTVNLSDLSSGVYMMRIANRHLNQTLKIIKK